MPQDGAGRDSEHFPSIGVLSVVVDERGHRRLLQADACIEITDAVLKQGDPDFIRLGDGIVTFVASNGSVSYGLCNHDDLRETWIGIRSDVYADAAEDEDLA